MRFLVFISILIFACSGNSTNSGASKYNNQANRVQIIRDNWGIPHIYGKTDADAVFGLMYVQCEENFERVERAYIEKLGRISEIDGYQSLYEDILARLLYDTSKAIRDYQASPEWLKKLCNAFADGVNFYMEKSHRKPLLLHRFEPWFAMLFTDGAYVSIQTGGLTSADLQKMYPLPKSGSTSFLQSPSNAGSNGFAIGPTKSASKNTLLYINPHVSFHFRMEAHMVSEEGLNAYGAVTWGQFFVYQGFNEHCGWMHTSSMADAADLFMEEISVKENEYYYQWDKELKKAIPKIIQLRYKKGNGNADHALTAYYTDHGPVVGKRDDNWLSLKSLTHSTDALIQSWQRMKATDLESFKKILNSRTNSTTNTLYADDKGNTSYWHGNFIPEKDSTLNYNIPVDGSISNTNWRGAHELDEIVHIINPQQGFIQNCNSTPFSVSGMNSINAKSFPEYMAPDGENFRSLLAINVLEKQNKFTLEQLIELGYNNYLGAFDSLLPPLFTAFDALHVNHNLKMQLKQPIEMLRQWDKRTSDTSTATTLAIIWAYNILSESEEPNFSLGNNQLKLFSYYINSMPAQKRLEILLNSFRGIKQSADDGKLPWGEINRYQRRSGKIQEEFSDQESSIPAPSVSSLFGCLPAYESTFRNTRKLYGYAGNSFVAAVEFGKKIKAKAINQGGQSFDPDSKHFNDQTDLFLNGKLRDVFFYREDVERNKERSYRPGE